MNHQIHTLNMTESLVAHFPEGYYYYKLVNFNQAHV